MVMKSQKQALNKELELLFRTYTGCITMQIPNVGERLRCEIKGFLKALHIIGVVDRSFKLIISQDESFIAICNDNYEPLTENLIYRKPK